MKVRKISLVAIVCIIIAVSALYYIYYHEPDTKDNKTHELEGHGEIPLSQNTVELPVHPVVVISHEELDHNLANLTNTEVWQSFAANYTMENCTIEFRDTIIKEMMAQAEEQGEDPDLLLACICAAYGNWSATPRAVPSYAERGIYLGRETWGIALNRANGPGPLCHMDIYYVNIEAIQTADPISGYVGCNSTFILVEDHCR